MCETNLYLMYMINSMVIWILFVFIYINYRRWKCQWELSVYYVSTYYGRCLLDPFGTPGVKILLDISLPKLHTLQLIWIEIDLFRKNNGGITIHNVFVLFLSIWFFVEHLLKYSEVFLWKKIIKGIIHSSK